MVSSAAMTRFAFAASPCSSRLSARGTTCQETPKRSLSQPHCPGWPPAESRSQKSSISACVSQFTTKETASVKWKTGPPLSATNSCPSSSKATVMTVPAGRPAARAVASS